MQNVLIVGGKSIDCNLIEALGAKVVGHWPHLSPEYTTVPKEVERVILVSDDIGVELAKHIVSICQKELIPLTHTKTANFAEALKSPLTIPEEDKYTKIAVPLFNPIRRSNRKERNMARRTDGRRNGLNTKRAEEKMDFVREMFKKDPLAKPDVVYDAVVKQFGRGLTPMTIAEIRASEFGIKYGPRGKIIHITRRGRKPKALVENQATVAAAVASAGVPAESTVTPPTRGEEVRTYKANALIPGERGSEDRLNWILHELKEEMAAHRMHNLSVDADNDGGRAVATVETEQEIQIH